MAASNVNPLDKARHIRVKLKSYLKPPSVDLVAFKLWHSGFQGAEAEVSDALYIIQHSMPAGTQRCEGAYRGQKGRVTLSTHTAMCDTYRARSASLISLHIFSSNI